MPVKIKYVMLRPTSTRRKARLSIIRRGGPKNSTITIIRKTYFCGPYGWSHVSSFDFSIKDLNSLIKTLQEIKNDEMFSM